MSISFTSSTLPTVWRNSKHLITFSAVLISLASLSGCGGIRVYSSPDGIPGEKKPLNGIPFYKQITRTKITEWIKKGPAGAPDEVIWSIEEPITVVDYSKMYVVEAVRNKLNPFESLEFNVKLNDNGTLSDVAYKSDPQLDEALKAAGDAKGAGLFGGVDDAMAPPQSIIDAAYKVHVRIVN